MIKPGGIRLEDLMNEMRTQRFGPGMDSSLKHWINMREGVIWSDSEWPFKRVRRSLITAQFGELVPPGPFQKVTQLETTDGGQVDYLEPELFNATYPTDNQDVGSPSNYTVLNSVIWLGPKWTGSIYISYDLRMCHYDLNGVLTEGPMQDVSDYPIYPVEYHYMLAVGGMASGLKVQNDPTWDALESEFGQMLTTMREDLLPPDQYGNSQYGRDNF